MKILKKEKKRKGITFDRARHKDGRLLHIHDPEVIRGNHYLCDDCSTPMTAYKGAIKTHHFAHTPQSLNNEYRLRDCDYSNETGRHKAAKAFLQRVKKVKVPPVNIYSPDGEKGYQLRRGKIVEAHSVEAFNVELEKQVYEDSEGNIHWGSNPEVKERFFKIQPDVIFLDKNNKPILFIEIVATHKIDPDKFAKIQKLGINTIRIKVAKGNTKDVEDSIIKGLKTKWVYNYEKENTEYLDLLNSDGANVLDVDEKEEELRRDVLACAKAEIGIAISVIKRDLGKESHSAVATGLRKELQRVQRNAKRVREQLSRRRGSIEDKVRATFAERRTRIEKQKEQIEGTRRGNQRKQEEIEREKREIEARNAEYRKEHKSSIEARNAEYRKKYKNSVEREMEQRFKEQTDSIEIEEAKITEEQGVVGSRRAKIAEEQRMVETYARKRLGSRDAKFREERKRIGIKRAEIERDERVQRILIKNKK